MLVLSRKLDESIRIITSDGVIEVKIVDHHRGNIKLGFDAPDSVAIFREEIYEPPQAHPVYSDYGWCRATKRVVWMANGKPVKVKYTAHGAEYVELENLGLKTLATVTGFIEGVHAG